MEAEWVETRVIPIGKGVEIGGPRVILMVGPCAVESYDQTRKVASAVHQAGGQVLRGGAYKPRTSPDTFPGLGLEGLKILREAADEFGLLIVTEAPSVELLPVVLDYTDIVQIGSRNMQHFPLLWAAGEANKPVLLKRGFMSTIDEWVSAGEHILKRGNDQIIFCERGIRGFDPSTRNVLDVSAIPLVKELCGYPVVGDPSHATGRTNLILPASRAAIAAGADGLLVETHPDPANALSDGDQALPLDQVDRLFTEARRIAAAINRTV
ncbi:MAG TPA: 3-deoxy-7-phosphoheptulonate synthase [Anaerolineales bacterium]|nr:3-deoxy-7-phosphoheptulonate synthase [Anaerolineales bacterium]